jgi:hypothetical protein
MKYTLVHLYHSIDVLITSEEWMFYILTFIQGKISRDQGLSNDCPFPVNNNGMIEEEK